MNWNEKRLHGRFIEYEKRLSGVSFEYRSIEMFIFMTRWKRLMTLSLARPVRHSNEASFHTDIFYWLSITKRTVVVRVTLDNSVDIWLPSTTSIAIHFRFETRKISPGLTTTLSGIYQTREENWRESRRSWVGKFRTECDSIIIQFSSWVFLLFISMDGWWNPTYIRIVLLLYVTMSMRVSLFTSPVLYIKICWVHLVKPG